MSSTPPESSQAERLEDVAVAGAGAGADEKENLGHRIPEQAPNGLVETHSDQSDGAVDPKADAGQDVKPPQEPQRSKGKVALIIGSLLVRIPNWTNVNASNAENPSDRRLPCCPRYCEFYVYYPFLFSLTRLSQTIITTAVPTITAHFHASQADYTWIGASYLLAASAATPTWGKISDIWGRNPIILLANSIFFVGSLISALSVDIRMLLAGRAVQGTAGGGLLVLANICISDLFSMRYIPTSINFDVRV